MNLPEAIKYCEEIADYLDCFDGKQRKRSDKHRQLADWLKLLKRILDSGDCNVCAIKKHCRVVPKLGEQVRYNCPMFVKKEVEV